MPKDPSAPIVSHGRTVRVLLALTATLSIMVAGVGGYAYKVFDDAQASVKKIPTVVLPGDTAATPKDFGPCVDDVCNYLILGSDSRKGLWRC